MNIISSTSL